MDEASVLGLQDEIAKLEKILTDKKRQLEEAINAIPKTAILDTLDEKHPNALVISAINIYSPPKVKIALYRSLFNGRQDVYAKRFESKNTGKSGYQPVCRSEWVKGVCEKPKKTCGNCTHRSFEPVTDEVIKCHLAGFSPAKNTWENPTPFVMGIYPLLQNETCTFLAVDFDKNTWKDDAQAFMSTCKLEGVPAALERSRSGNGGHVWIFFDKPVLAAKARRLGSFLMTRTLDSRPEIGLDSFDRFFPSQDTLPKGGFGNLIALPLQKAARDKNHSVFLDDNMIPHTDQWAYLASINRMSEVTLDQIIKNAIQRNELLPVTYEPVDAEDEAKPWQRKSVALPIITETLPLKVEIVLADQLYINHTGLPPVLRNRILRLASFANPEFYQAQKMRLPTWNKPHILCCYEFLPQYIGLPVCCLDGLLAILEHYQIKAELVNKQNKGRCIDVKFHGELREDQKTAVKKLMASQTGILSASTAFGKTVVALWMIAERKVNTVILVHRKMLADQWVERLNQFLGIPKKEIGYYSGTKKKRTGIIDIVVMQSIVKKDTVVDWISDYGQIIVDECHHISAVSFERIIRKCPAQYRLGLSATVVRKDGQHPIVLMNLGDVRYSDNRKSTASLFVQKVFPRLTGFCMPNPSLDGGYDQLSYVCEQNVQVSKRQNATENSASSIHTIFQSLYKDEDRNRLIVGDIMDAYHEGRECLVLSERLEHLDILKDALHEQVQSLFVLKGGMGKKQLKAIMEAIQSTSEQKIILATGKYLGEGFDMPSLDTLFLAFPFSWKGMLVQYTGRLNRTFHGKKEIRVYDYVDSKEQVLARMFARRLKGYKALGFEVVSQ